MATPEELQAAGIDSAAFLRYCKDWYDGSIRAMDVEVARLVERIRALGLADRTLLVFFADHGEEFHDHGRMWHGQSVYNEMVHVPLVFWAPGRVKAGTEVAETVQLIDVMPTLLDMSGVRVPAAAQGQSLRPLVTGTPGWNPRPAVAEKQPMGREGFPNMTESYAIVDGGYKLVHNVVKPESMPEYELFDFAKDPLDQHDVAAQHPDQVKRLQAGLEGWKKAALAARLPPDTEAAKSMSAEQLERLRALGYVK
jgi:arylsulfatase A-like enzyme